MSDLNNKTAMYAAMAAVIYLALFFFFDRAIDLWVHSTLSNTWLFQVGKCLSALATGSYIKLGIAFCFILILVFDSGIKRQGTRFLLYICICGAIAIVVGDGLKYLLGRYRPIMLFDHNVYGLHFFSSEWALNSTPSGHTLRSFTILTALSMLYRRFTPVFIALAVLIGASRVVVTAHYPSDIVFGAFIGIFTALWTYKHFLGKDSELNK
ncbi:MAG TPA: phosphatase PAP2 family protein [Syntrophorhabdaceae bacterium]|nr:phosphatase PAP2 family protein [Syntrophorhabdaceae bacterium]